MTFTRVALLGIQIRVALKRTTNISEYTLGLIVDKALENMWITQYIVYGFDKDGLCRAQLTLDIDWDEHTLLIKNGKASVTIDERWTDNTAIEVDEAVNLFKKFTYSNSLRVEWQVHYSPWVYNTPGKKDEVQNALGLVTANPIKWAGPTKSIDMAVPELSELKVGLRLQDQ